MTTTEIDLHRPQAQPSAIPAKLAYARELANSGLLPAAYRKNPGNVLWAIEYGDMLGLPVMAAITGVHVIEGKPTASAGLISGLVRHAGHRLRVWGDNKSATCQITRSDDPQHPFTVTWTLRTEPGDNPSAELAGLLGKNTWKNYPAAMLKARAITQCARDACEEALFGLHYTPEELGEEVDEDGVVLGSVTDDAPQQPAVRLAERSGGTPEDDQWYGPDPDAGAPEDMRPWADIALERAAGITSDAAGDALWREAGARCIAGDCTPDEQTHIQNLVTEVMYERHRKAMELRLAELSEDDDDWRDRIRGIADGDVPAARALLAEVGQLKAAGTMNETRAGRLGGAVIALCPRAALADAEAAA